MFKKILLEYQLLLKKANMFSGYLERALLVSCLRPDKSGLYLPQRDTPCTPLSLWQLETSWQLA